MCLCLVLQRGEAGSSDTCSPSVYPESHLCTARRHKRGRTFSKLLKVKTIDTRVNKDSDGQSALFDSIEENYTSI